MGHSGIYIGGRGPDRVIAKSSDLVIGKPKLDYDRVIKPNVPADGIPDLGRNARKDAPFLQFGI